ncbi:MAG: hypothetical protein WBZ05_12335 [Desulfobacterales bacterium]
MKQISEAFKAKKKQDQQQIMAYLFQKSEQNKVMALFIRDNDIRRLGLARREFSYDMHIPERRSVEDRRSGLDRRLMPRTAE